MVLDFPTNVPCRVSCGIEWPHAGSVERLAHGRDVGWHEDEPDVGMCQSMEGQELLTDVHSAHVHGADPWSGAIGVQNSGVQLCEEGCEGRRRRPVALRMRGGQQRLVEVGGFHGGGLALKNKLVVHVRHEIHGEVAARGSPLGLLKEYPNDRMNARDWGVEKR